MLNTISRRFKSLRRDQRLLGFYQGSRWFAFQTLERRGKKVPVELRVHPKSLTFPLHVRAHGSSDVDVFEEIFIDNGLRLDLLPPEVSPKLILDLGANVGFSSIAFLNQFPNAFVVAVEPDPSNVIQLRRNLQPYADRTRIIEGAIWNSSTRLALSRGTFGDGREWATEVRPASASETPDTQAFTIPEILAQSPTQIIDLLKIDIEGSEVALFSSASETWLPSVRNLFVEIHGEEARRVVLRALDPFEYQMRETPEFLMFLNMLPKT